MEFNTNLTIEEWTNNNDLAISIFNGKYKNGDETFMETIDRISGGNEEIKQLILEKKFLPGGRIISNRGLEKHGRKVSLSNCYVMPQVEDNLESIFDTAKMMARTFSYGGKLAASASLIGDNQ
jgi:ribonucleoside-diphosphate reductase alpha chain